MAALMEVGRGEVLLVTAAHDCPQCQQPATNQSGACFGGALHTDVRTWSSFQYIYRVAGLS